MNRTIPHPSWIEIDLDQFKHNISLIKKHIDQALLCLPVKANAYGHGLCQIAQAAVDAGVDYLAVAHLQEGIQLREASIDLPILVLGAIHEDQILDLIGYNLEFTIASKFKADLVAAKCENAKCRVHLEVDTGMQRTGIRPSNAAGLYCHLDKLGCFDVVGIYTHLASATGTDDPITLGQIESFKTLMQNPVFETNSLIKHMANSGGTIYYPQAHMDMVRPSMAAFGYLPEDAPEPLNGIRPFFSLKSRVSYFKVVEKGMGISYGHSHITEKQTRIVTVPVGYGDGFRRSLSNKGSVLIRGKKFPIVGAICMDQFMVDVSDHEVYVGDEVVLIGKQGDMEITVDEIASLCGTIPYEVICFFNDRLPRIYVEKPQYAIISTL